MSDSEKIMVGWREWVALPELNLPAIKAKVDTGARTSAIHAFDIEPFLRGDEEWVRFSVLPMQNNDRMHRRCEARIVDSRQITDSGGHQQRRIVVATTLVIGDLSKTIELTLTERSTMMFRMLIGRTALQPETIIDPSESFLCGRLRAKQLYSNSEGELQP